MTRLHLRLFTALLAVLVVAACSQPSEPQPRGPEGAVRSSPGAPVDLGAALILVDIDSVASLEAAAVTEFQEGYYLGPVTSIDEDGNVIIELPAGDDLPSALMSDADEFLYNVAQYPGCALSASNATVDVTEAVFELITFPGVALLSVEGLIPALATNERMPASPDIQDLAGMTFQTWVYAAGATTINTVPAVCTAASNPSLSVDVSLSSGWNQLEWAITIDAADDLESMTLRNSTAEELHITSLNFMMSTVLE